MMMKKLLICLRAATQGGAVRGKNRGATANDFSCILPSRVLQTPRVGGSLWFDARGGKELHFLSSLDSSNRFRLMPHLGRAIQVVTVLKNVQPELQAAVQKVRQKIDALDSVIVDKCESQPCKNEGHCVNDPGMTYHCSCPKGRTGAHCEEDVNECATPPCAGYSNCINTEGSYRCVCRQGWKGDFCLTDIDECVQGTAVCNSTHSKCRNTDGTYDCVCPERHEGPNCEPIPTTIVETTVRPSTTMLPTTTNALTPEPSVEISGPGNRNSGVTSAGNSGENAGGANAGGTGGQGGTNDLCGQTSFLAGSGYVTSPNYPDHYPNNVDCTYRIATTPGKLVLIRFIDEFGLESDNDGTCKYDRLTVVLNGTTTLGTYCGGQEPPSTITGATVDVRLRTDFAISRKGFRLRYEAIDPDSVLDLPETLSTCDGSTTTTVSGVKRTLTSPMFPNKYPDDLSCSWTFLAPRDKFVEVRFLTLFVEAASKCNYDRVIVLIDGVETGDGPYCTDNKPTEAFYGRDITVKFISDASVAEQGFEMTYQSVQGGASLKKRVTLTEPLPCGETSFSNTGILESPDYPQKYPNGLHCAWNILVTKGRRVKLWFETFDVEAQTYCQYDRVVVETHPGNYHQLCNSKQISPLESRDNQMKVTFITDTALAFTGFRAFWVAQQGDTEKHQSRVVNVEEGKTAILDCGDSNSLMGDPVILTLGSPKFSWSHEGTPLAADWAVLAVRGEEASAGRYLCVATSNVTDVVLMLTFNVTVRDADWFGSGEGSGSGTGPGSGTDLSDEEDGMLSETADLTSAQNPLLWDGDSEIWSSPGSGEGLDLVDGTVAPTTVVTTGRVGAMGEGFESQGNGEQGQGSVWITGSVRRELFESESENEEVPAHTEEEAMGVRVESHDNVDQGQGLSSVNEELFGYENENEQPETHPESANPPSDTVDDIHTDNDIDVIDNDINAITTQSSANGNGHDTNHVTTETTTRENEQSTNHDTEQGTNHDTPQDHDTAYFDAYPMSKHAQTSLQTRDIYAKEGSVGEVHPLLAVQAFTREIAHQRDLGDLSQASLFHALGIGDDAFAAEGIEASFLDRLRGLDDPTAAGLLQALGVKSSAYVEKNMEAVFGEMHRLREAGNHTVASLLKSLGMAPDPAFPQTQPERPEQGAEIQSDPLANLTSLFSAEIDPGEWVGEGGSFAKTFADIMEMSAGWGKKKK
uniref:Cubilin n=1 Tax=Branchiostoma floridae TaxID=7739 RepID=C3YTQ5_BRAFL|eukprot:XP_002600170.1 hypothetical protein BRAFLDRAFT_66678 [Branchiostoma floridae]